MSGGRRGRVARLRELLAAALAFCVLSLLLLRRLGPPAGRPLPLPPPPPPPLPPPSAPPALPPQPTCRLRALLDEVERAQVGGRAAPRALVRGPPELLAGARAQLAPLLRDLGLTLASDRDGDDGDDDGDDDDTGEWSLLLCVAGPGAGDGEGGGGGECVGRAEYAGLRPRQRVGRLPGLEAALGRRALCRSASLLPAPDPGPVLAPAPAQAPECFALPQQREQASRAAMAAAADDAWMLKPRAGRPRRVSSYQLLSRLRSKGFLEDEESIVEKFIPRQLRIMGLPISLHLFVLITSIAPLRAYIFDEGIVHFRHGEEKGFRKMGRRWVSSQLARRLAAARGAAAAAEVTARVDALLAGALLAAEALLLLQLAALPAPPAPPALPSGRYRCEHCFQLLEMEVLLNDSLHPHLVGARPLPAAEAERGPRDQEEGEEEEGGAAAAADAVRPAAVRDALRMVLASDRVAAHVHRALRAAALQRSIGVAGLRCLPAHDLCLTAGDLGALLAARREALRRGRFRRLYPAALAAADGAQRALAARLRALHPQGLLADPAADLRPVHQLLRESLRHGTADLHWVATRLAQLGAAEEAAAALARRGGSGAGGRALGIRLTPRVVKTEENEVSYSYSPATQLGHQRVEEGSPCSTDVSLAPYLAWLRIEPPIDLEPAFSPLWLRYQAVVDYDQTMLSISAGAHHCSTVVHFEHRQGLRWSMNTTLGVGENSIAILTLGGAGREVLASYQLTVRREARTAREPAWDEARPHQVCGLRQVRVFPQLWTPAHYFFLHVTCEILDASFQPLLDK